MAVTFQIGNNTVTVNASELAQEDTQKQLLNSLNNLSTALGAVKNEDQQSNNILQGIKRQLQTNQTESRKDEQETRRSMSSRLSGAYSTAEKTASQTTFDSAFSTFMNSIGATQLAMSMGMVNSVMIQLGETFRLTNRIGLDFGDNFTEINKELANIGLDFGMFSKIVGTNIEAIRTLGDSVTDGSTQFRQMIASFRDTAREFGSFSYTSAEMAELLGEELELRRGMMDSEKFRNMTTEDFTQSMIENLKQQQAMARVTGQDVRERIKAQMEAKKSVIAQSFLNEQSEETRKQFEDVAAALTAVPGGDQLAQAIINGIATDLPANAFAPELIAMLGSGAEDLISFITDGMETGNLDISELEKRAREVADGVGIGSGTLRTMAATGNQIAEQILTVQQRTVRVQDEISKLYQESYKELTDGNNATRKALGAITIDLEKQSKLIGSLKLDAITKIIGDGAGSMAENFEKFNQSINKMLGGEFAENLAEGIGSALGKLGPEMLVNAASGEGLDNAETAFILGIVANMAGFTKLGNALQATQMGAAGLAGITELVPDAAPTNQAEIDAAMEQGIVPPAMEFASPAAEKAYKLKEQMKILSDTPININDMDQLLIAVGNVVKAIKGVEIVPIP